MNGSQTLYLESLLNIQIGSLNFNATEFEGHITMDDISRLCDEGMIMWQNPHAPRSHIAYIGVPFNDGVYEMAIDPTTNTIVIAGMN